MISVNQAKKYCKNYTQIKNYEKAVNDPNTKWDCHHIFELKCPVIKALVPDLIAYGLYYDRPAEELIFLTPQEHHKLHADINNRFSGKKHSEETRKLMSLHNAKPFQGRHHTPESIEKNRLAHLGKKHSKEFGEKVTERNVGRKWFTDGINNKFCFECPKGYRPGRSEFSYRGVVKQNAKKTLCVTTGQIFDSATEAALYFGLLDPCVRRAARNNKTYGVYNGKRLAWRYI